MKAKPKTIETCIRNLEERMRRVQCHEEEPPRGYQRAEWLRESHRQLQTLKMQRLQMPVD
jgi:hypothetical protein